MNTFPWGEEENSFKCPGRRRPRKLKESKDDRKVIQVLPRHETDYSCT
jgi:hypothetical protein